MGDTPSARTPAKEEQANPYDMNGRRSTEPGIPAAAHVIRHLPSFTDVRDEVNWVRPNTQVTQSRHELERENSPSARTPAKEEQATYRLSRVLGWSHERHTGP